MAMVIGEDTEIGKELAKWNKPKREGGMNCNGFEPYPRMLYQAHPTDNGKILVADPFNEDFTRRCQVIVHSAEEEARYTKQGWYLTQGDALDGYEREQIAIAEATARRHFSDQRMTDKAKDEAASVDAATDKHVPDIPRKKGN